jgi:hypothetical protein
MVDEATLSRGMLFLSDDSGTLPKWTTTLYDLYEALERIADSRTVDRLDVIWYVEATDGVFVTRSDGPSPGLTGYRLSLVKDKGLGSEPPLAERVFLAQSYPNPFNPSTRIEFMTTRHGPVTLRIYNLFGEAVATLHEGMLDAGRHVRDFDGGKLPAGVYVCRLEAEGLVLSTGMVLLK